MLADSVDGQKLGWIRNLERMGSPGGRVCEALCGLCSAFCLQGTQRRLRTGRAHVLAWGTPRNAGLAWDAQGDVMAARMIGIRQEGIKSLPDGAVQEGREAQTAAMTSRKKSAAVNCRAGGAHYEKKRVEKSKPRFG